MCRSVLKYASPVWDPYLQPDTDNLECIQRKGARFVLRDFRQRSSVTSMLRYLKWKSLAKRRTKARLIIMYHIIKGKIAIPIDMLIYNQDGVDVSFNILTIINSTQIVFIHGQSVLGTYYHPGSKILPLWTISRTDYPSVTTKLVPPPPHCDTHLGETSIRQIQNLCRNPMPTLLPSFAIVVPYQCKEKH